MRTRLHYDQMKSKIDDNWTMSGLLIETTKAKIGRDTRPTLALIFRGDIFSQPYL